LITLITKNFRPVLEVNGNIANKGKTGKRVKRVERVKRVKER
jgi:hypothetical protein